MSDEYTPTQYRYLEPYLNMVFEHNNPQSFAFLSRYNNNLLKLFGNDLVVSGLDIDDISIGDSSTSISITLNSGSLIQDLTYIEVNESSVITFEDAHLQDTSGYYIVFSDYRWLHNPYLNPLRIKIDYVDDSGTVLDGWSTNNNRIVFAAIRFEVDEGSIIVAEDATLSSITINSTEYLIPKRLELDLDEGWL